MDSDAEEIWKNRLRKDVDVTKIKDKQTLLDEIDDTPDSYVSKKGKTVDLTQAKENLKKNVEDLFKGSDSLKEDVYGTNISDLKEATTKDKVNEIQNRFINIPNMDSDRKSLFQGEIAIREREIVGERKGEITRQELLDLGFAGRSLRKVSDEIDISQDEAREMFEREGFTIERGKIRK